MEAITSFHNEGREDLKSRTGINIQKLGWWVLTWARPKVTHDDFHSMPLTWPPAMLSRWVTASSGPGLVAMPTASSAFFPETPFWPVTVDYRKVKPLHHQVNSNGKHQPGGSPKVKNRCSSLLNTCRSIPGHSLFWQCRVSESDPWHSLPPLAGSGLLQSRLLFWMPFPQLTLQGLQADHSENPPCTANETLGCCRLRLASEHVEVSFHWVCMLAVELRVIAEEQPWKLCSKGKINI